MQSKMASYLEKLITNGTSKIVSWSNHIVPPVINLLGVYKEAYDHTLQGIQDELSKFEWSSKEEEAIQRLKAKLKVSPPATESTHPKSECDAIFAGAKVKNDEEIRKIILKTQDETQVIEPWEAHWP